MEIIINFEGSNFKIHCWESETIKKKNIWNFHMFF